MSDIFLTSPVHDVFVVQPFGVNYLDFYKQWGLNGHPGIDFRAKRGCPIRASHAGVITWCGQGKDGGIGVELWDDKNCFKTFYYHHAQNGSKVQVGIRFGRGEMIALADNTGKYTTGDHEHFELYLTDIYGNTINRNNGFNGSIDPAPYFSKNWEKDNAYHRYGREQNWLAEWQMRFKNVWLHKQLQKRGRHPLSLTTSECNALVYGGWDFDAIMNPAMYQIWGWLKKGEYESGERAFCR